LKFVRVLSGLNQTGDCHVLTAYPLSDFGQDRAETGNGQFIFRLGVAEGDVEEERRGKQKWTKPHRRNWFICNLFATINNRPSSFRFRAPGQQLEERYRAGRDSGLAEAATDDTHAA
jgi:hypothetical protein